MIDGILVTLPSFRWLTKTRTHTPNCKTKQSQTRPRPSSTSSHASSPPSNVTRAKGPRRCSPSSTSFCGARTLLVGRYLSTHMSVMTLSLTFPLKAQPSPSSFTTLSVSKKRGRCRCHRHAPSGPPGPVGLPDGLSNPPHAAQGGGQGRVPCRCVRLCVGVPALPCCVFPSRMAWLDICVYML